MKAGLAGFSFSFYSAKKTGDGTHSFFGLHIMLYMNFKTRSIHLLRIVALSLLLTYSTSLSSAQDIDGVHSFLVGGVSINIPNSNKLLLYGGHSPTDNVKAIVALPNIRVNKYITITPGYTNVNVNLEDSPSITEHHLLAMATFAIPIAQKWTIVNRNMYFHRFRKNVDDLSFYRNRVGIIHQTQMLNKQASVFLQNEIYLNIDNGKFSRNRIIAGGDIKLFKWLTPQVMYMYQSDTLLGNRHLAWFIGTVPLENFGVFANK